MMADEATEAGLELPSPPNDVKARLTGLLPFAGLQNPIDVTGQVLNQPNLLEEFVNTLVASGTYDVLVIFVGHLASSPALVRPLISALYDAVDRSRISVFVSALRTLELVEFCETHRIPLFENPVRAVHVAATTTDLASSSTRMARAPRMYNAKPLLGAKSGFRRTVLDEYASLRFLDSIGIPIVRSELLMIGFDRATLNGLSLRPPYAVKVCSSDIPHKAEAGAVALGVASIADVIAVADRLVEHALTYRPEARIEGIIIEEMLAGDAELLVGFQRDEVFGPVVVVGPGGRGAEAYGGQRLLLPSLDEGEVAQALSDGAVGQLVRRVGPKADDCRAAVVAAVMSLSQAALRDVELLEADINPLILDGVVGTAVAVDALVVRSTQAEAGAVGDMI